MQIFTEIRKYRQKAKDTAIKTKKRKDRHKNAKFDRKDANTDRNV